FASPHLLPSFFFTPRPPPRSTLFPYTTLFRSTRGRMVQAASSLGTTSYQVDALGQRIRKTNTLGDIVFHYDTRGRLIAETDAAGDRKSTRLNSSHVEISYAVFCLKKKKKQDET